MAEPEARRFALTYRLTRDDVAAYENLPGELGTRAKFALLAPLFILGASAGWLASEFDIDTGAWGELTRYAVIGAVIAVWFGLATLGLSVSRYRRIRRFALPQGDVMLSAGGDGVLYDEGARAECHSWADVPFVHAGRAHVFMKAAGRRVIIVPLRAFADAGEMHGFAEFADASSRAASP